MPQTNAVSQAGESRMSEWIALTNKRAMRPEALPETPKKSPGWCSPQFVSARRNMMSGPAAHSSSAPVLLPRPNARGGHPRAASTRALLSLNDDDDDEYRVSTRREGGLHTRNGSDTLDTSAIKAYQDKLLDDYVQGVGDEESSDGIEGSSDDSEDDLGTPADRAEIRAARENAAHTVRGAFWQDLKKDDHVLMRSALERTDPAASTSCASTKYITSCWEKQLIPDATIRKLWNAENGTVNLKSYGLGSSRAAAMASALEDGSARRIFDIDLSDNRLSGPGAHQLLSKLNAGTLRKLDISGNPIGEKGIAQIERILGASATLTCLNLERTRLKDSHVERICNAVTASMSMTELNLARNTVLPRGTAAGALKSMIRAGGAMYLKVLNLSWMKLAGRAAQAVAVGLADAQHITDLDLSWNAFGSSDSDASAAALTAALKTNRVLTHLDLRQNRLTAPQCAALAEALKANHTLYGLHLSGNAAQVDARGFLLPHPQRKCNQRLDGGTALDRNTASSPLRAKLPRGFLPDCIAEPRAATGPAHLSLPQDGEAGAGAGVGTARRLARGGTVRAAAVTNQDGEELAVRRLGTHNTGLRTQLYQPSEDCFAHNTHLFTRTVGGSQRGTTRAGEEVDTSMETGRSRHAWRETARCWVCDRFQQHTFEWTPGESDDGQPHLKSPVNVYLRSSVDNWERVGLEKDKKKSKGKAVVWAVTRMVPPGTAHFVFELEYNRANGPESSQAFVVLCNQQRPIVELSRLQQNAGNEAVQQLQQAKKVTVVPAVYAYLNEQEPAAAKGEPKGSKSPAKVGGKPAPAGKGKGGKKGGKAGGGGSKASAAAAAAAAAATEAAMAAKFDPAEPELFTVPLFVNALEAGERHESEQIRTPARQQGGGNTFVPQKIPWTFPISLFAAYQQDTDELMAECFEHDWNHCTVCRAVKDEEQLALVRGELQRNWPLLREVFKEVSGEGLSPPLLQRCRLPGEPPPSPPTPTHTNAADGHQYAITTAVDPFVMGQNTFTDFINDCRVLDDGPCNLAKVDMLFIGCNLIGPKHLVFSKTLNPQRMLARFQLMDIVGKLALAKYSTAAAGSGSGSGSPKQSKALTPHEAVCKMLEVHVRPCVASLHHSQAWRWDRYWVEACDLYLKANITKLKDLYRCQHSEQRAALKPPAQVPSHRCWSDTGPDAATPSGPSPMLGECSGKGACSPPVLCCHACLVRRPVSVTDPVPSVPCPPLPALLPRPTHTTTTQSPTARNRPQSPTVRNRPLCAIV
jgi:Ran GTPase-activating protein (RanGAP) involved in mRNA processing and transport